MKDVAFFVMNVATLAFFCLDCFDMVLDFIQVDKLAVLCEDGCVETTLHIPRLLPEVVCLQYQLSYFTPNPRYDLRSFSDLVACFRD
jgi:hypothetical protein